MKPSSPATCWTCVLVTAVAWSVGSAIAARTRPAWAPSKASTAAATSDVERRVAAWITIADLVANEAPHSRLSRWCERRLRKLILEPTGPIAQGGPHGDRRGAGSTPAPPADTMREGRAGETATHGGASAPTCASSDP